MAYYPGYQQPYIGPHYEPRHDPRYALQYGFGASPYQRFYHVPDDPRLIDPRNKEALFWAGYYNIPPPPPLPSIDSRPQEPPLEDPAPHRLPQCHRNYKDPGPIVYECYNLCKVATSNIENYANLEEAARHSVSNRDNVDSQSNNFQSIEVVVAMLGDVRRDLESVLDRLDRKRFFVEECWNIPSYKSLYQACELILKLEPLVAQHFAVVGPYIEKGDYPLNKNADLVEQMHEALRTLRTYREGSRSGRIVSWRNCRHDVMDLWHEIMRGK